MLVNQNKVASDVLTGLGQHLHLAAGLVVPVLEGDAAVVGVFCVIALALLAEVKQPALELVDVGVARVADFFILGLDVDEEGFCAEGEVFLEADNGVGARFPALEVIGFGVFNEFGEMKFTREVWRIDNLRNHVGKPRVLFPVRDGGLVACVVLDVFVTIVLIRKGAEHVDADMERVHSGNLVAGELSGALGAWHLEFGLVVFGFWSWF